MILGSYYLTMVKDGEPGEGKVFRDVNEAIMAYNDGLVGLHAPIRVRFNGVVDGKEVSKLVWCTVGFLVFNESVPQDLGFIDRTDPEHALDLEITFSLNPERKRVMRDGEIVSVPASEVKDYAETVAAYTQGRGRLQLSLHGYAPCHNTEEVVAEIGYDPEADVENTPDSVFCAHGAGFNVKWDEVKNHMHLESGLREEKAPQIITRNVRYDDKELEKIMEREFGPIRRPLYNAKASNRPATEEISIKPPKQKYMIVDGYNIIFAWEELAAQARADLEAARRQLCDILSSYAGFTKCRLVVVFDGWKQKGNPGEKSRLNNIQVVYTREGETADAYIEALADEIGNNYAVRVASSDSLVQLSSFRSGVLRMSARELREEVESTRREMGKHFSK